VLEIKTERLIVRPFTFDDAPFILRLLNEPSFIENIVDKGVRDLEGARGYLRDGPMASYARHGFGLWRVGLSENDQPIGMAGLLKRDYFDAMDIGYALLPEYCGAGYAFEATSAIMDYARDDLKAEKVLAIVFEENVSSIRLLGKLGFESDGVVRIPGNDKDTRLFVSSTNN
jgi:[ribosomal protein S5]-alanine N-acetyltransferase